MSGPLERWQEVGRLRLTVLVTVYNDWLAFKMLLDELGDQLDVLPDRLDVAVVAVDDASPENAEHKRAILASSPLPLTVLTLARNLGNQRAIAIGLCHVVTTGTDLLVVMDGDGEDRPRDVTTLVGHLLGNPAAIVTAQRHRRSEALQYKLCYLLFKTLFRSLTGTRMNFGNFSAMSFENAERLCSMHELLLSYPATILASRLPIERVPINRGNRYMGRSGITYLGLAVHGLSSIAVFSDKVLARMLVACAWVFGVGFLAVIAAVTAKITGLAAPGWTTSVVGFTLAALLESAVAILSGALIVLNSRQAQNAMPLQLAERFIKRIDQAAQSDAFAPQWEDAEQRGRQVAGDPLRVP